MRIIVLFLMITLSTSVSFGQMYIGWTEGKLRNYLKEEKVGEISKHVESDGIKIMSWSNLKMKYTETVFFNSSAGIIKLYSIHPDNQTIFNMLVRIYDENFVKISSTLWKAYLYGTTYKIEAKYSDGLSSYMFYISEWDI